MLSPTEAGAYYRPPAMRYRVCAGSGGYFFQASFTQVGHFFLGLALRMALAFAIAFFMRAAFAALPAVFFFGAAFFLAGMVWIFKDEQSL